MCMELLGSLVVPPTECLGRYRQQVRSFLCSL